MRPFFANNFRRAFLAGLGIAVLAAAGRPAQILAIEVFDYEAARHDRFENDPAFIGSAFDWSGVGSTGSGRWVTMISDSFFIAAEHWKPSGDVIFHYSNDPLGGSETRTIDPGFGMEIGGAGSDIWLGQLTAPASASVASYDLLDLGPLGDFSDYEGAFLYTVGIADGANPTNFRVGSNQIVTGSVAFRNTTGTGGVLNNWSYYLSYDTLPPRYPDESVVEIGDSGAPSFAIDGGVLKLVGIHSELGDFSPGGPSDGDITVDSLVGAYAGEIESAIIPEPSTGFLFATGSLILFLRRPRRR